jgi:multisubunit Na+/H+ antiporter MnhE subunit
MFVDISGQFSITVAIAGAVRLRQLPPFFEIAFMQSLAIAQFLGMLCVTFASGVAMTKPRNIRRVMVSCCYMIILFGFYIVMQLSVLNSQQTVDTLQQMADFCPGYARVWPSVEYLPPPYWDNWGTLVVSFFLACIYGIGAAWCILRKRSSFRAGPVSLGFAVATIVCFVQLQQTRDAMKSVTGTNFQDNKWGFGQVMAVLMWAPLLLQAMHYSSGNFQPFNFFPAVKGANQHLH